MALPALITFDVGGTLLSPFPSVGQAYAEELAELGYASDAKHLQRRFETALTKAYGKPPTERDVRDDRGFWRAIVQETIRGEVPPAAFDEAFEQLYEAFASARRWRILDGAREVLTEVRARGIRMAILSNSDPRTRTVLAEHDLAHFFEAIFLSSEIGFEKPDHRLFDHVKATVDLPPAAILHVGDSPRHDFEAAERAGWRAFLVSSHGQSLRDLLEVL